MEEPKFNSKDFIRQVSRELVENFDNAGKATTSGLKGIAKENEIRNKLEMLLPAGVGVGTGCVIDNNGNASKQQDVIIYEKSICPKFSVNNTPEATYYPCEGVICVGEIKSDINKKELLDSFSKIESVKKLKRLHFISKSKMSGQDIVSFRSYLTTTAWDCTKKEEFNQEKNDKDQIYGFVLCDQYKTKIDTLKTYIEKKVEDNNGKNLPNIIISLRGGIFHPFDSQTKKLCRSIKTKSDYYIFGTRKDDNFEYLLTRIYKIIREGRSVEVNAFDYYILSNPKEMKLMVHKKFIK